VAHVPSRQDQLHSYQYSLQRVVAALVTHDPDPHRSPLRRAGTTALVSLVIAALAVGGVAIYGVLAGAGGGRPESDAVVYIEKRSGARYILDSDAGRLHPVLNFSSALLIAKAQAPDVRNVSHAQLAKLPLGDPLGIPDAPDSLPSTDDLLTAPWSVCTQTDHGVASGAGPGAQATSTLLVGDRLTDGRVAAAGGEAILVRDPAHRAFLVYGNRRFPIPSSRYTATLSVLGWGERRPWPVAAGWINAVPLGPALEPLTIRGFGDPSTIDGYRVGQLVTDGQSADAAHVQWAVVLADGISVVTELQAKLLLTEPDHYPPERTGTDFAQLTFSHTLLSDADDPGALPSTVPALAPNPQRACMTLPIGKDGAGIRIDPTTPAGTAVTGDTVPGSVQADFVHVTRGKGAVVVSAASPSAPATTGTLTIVTDTGRRYAVAGREALGKLGYGGVSMPQVPAELVALLPQGPALDPARARQPLSAGR
jgi:type VII secretion protein EccB